MYDLVSTGSEAAQGSASGFPLFSRARHCITKLQAGLSTEERRILGTRWSMLHVCCCLTSIGMCNVGCPENGKFRQIPSLSTSIVEVDVPPKKLPAIVLIIRPRYRIIFLAVIVIMACAYFVTGGYLSPECVDIALCVGKRVRNFPKFTHNLPS